MNKKEFKLNPQKIARRLVQLTFFILLPGLFTSAFYAMKNSYTSILSGNFSLLSEGGSLLLLTSVVIITGLMGRFFCGFICSFGTLGDFIWFLSKKTVNPKFRISPSVDGILKYLKYVILIAIVVVFWTIGVTIDATVSPWTVFGMFATIGNYPSVSNLFTVGGFLLFGIIIASFFIERFFCRYLCPLGAVFAIVSKIRIFRIKKPRVGCNGCSLCTKKCSMGISLDQVDQVNSGECIHCFACVEICPRNNVKANPNPAIATAVSVAAIGGLMYSGTLVMATSQTSKSAEFTSASIVKGAYTDGTYTGEGNGFKGETKVSVTVENGNITDITVISTGDDKEYFDQAKTSVIQQIIETQDTAVDVVSGATFSSNGIIAAVENALTLDANTNSNNESGNNQYSSDSISETTESETTESEATETETTVSGSYTDGTYTGTGTGFRGDTDVSVTVDEGVITEITVISYQDDEPYFVKAQSSVISDMISSQDIQVDAVSGATFSSNGIMEAVANALGVEYTNPNATLDKGHGQGGSGERPSRR